MSWSREGGNLSVEATESGKVLSYRLYEEDVAVTSPGRGSFDPSFPALTRAQAQTIAKTFVDKVLVGAETAVFTENPSARLSTGTHRFGGEIRLNGLSSPLSFSVSVRTSDGAVTSFRRDSLEGSTIGGVPSAKAAASKGAAGELLKDTLALRLEYVLADAAEGEARTAVLRYLPEAGDQFYVDAQTGKLVNLTELYQKADEGGFANGMTAASADMAAPEAAAGDSTPSLSRVEQEGIAKLEGVLSKEALDKTIRGITALGLSRYTLGSVSYSVDKETGDVSARITYSRRESDGRLWRRTVLCDAKTGDLLSVSSSAPHMENQEMSVPADKAQEIAASFLTGLWGADFAKTDLYAGEPWESGSWGAFHSFTFAQKENGYFLPENRLSVSVDVTDGSISGLERSWTADVTFDSPEGIVDEAAALTAWFEHYDVSLAYRSVPVQLDPGASGAAPLLEAGYAYFYGLKLSYALEEETYCQGVDAKSGQVVTAEAAADRGALTYSDLDGHWVKDQAEALALYGIGWQGGAFRPEEALKQRDLVALLVSTSGYLFDPAEGDPDDLYRRAYDMGLLTRADRADERPVTRGEIVKLLLDGLGYREAAGFTGIYTCSYADRDQISAELLGYAALAQGLGLVSGTGSFAADRTATRAEAAVLLYNLMSR